MDPRNASGTRRRNAYRLGAAVLAGVLSAPTWADDPGYTPLSAGLGDFSGAEIYQHICQGCHMANGAGAVGAGHYPKLAGDAALVSWQYTAILILNGRGAMPAFGLQGKGRAGNPGTPFYMPHLTDAQVAEVVNYVRSHFGNAYKEKVTEEQVQKLPRARE
jgi:mono/diheme cytochrome c family protein